MKRCDRIAEIQEDCQSLANVETGEYETPLGEKVTPLGKKATKLVFFVSGKNYSCCKPGRDHPYVRSCSATGRSGSD